MYIDKDVLVAEIESSIRSLEACLRGEFPMAASVFLTEQCKGRLDAYKNVLSLINALEIKEVDLDKALSDLDKNIKEFVITEEFERESETCGHYWTIAKHAFLLGLKAQKGE